MERHLVGQVASLGDLDRVDLADQVGDRDVGRRQLLGVAAIAGQPIDRGILALAVDDRAGRGGDRRVRVVVELPAAEHRQPLVEQADQQAGHPCLGLPALAEEHEIMAGQDRVLDGRDDRVLIPHDAGQDLAAVGKARDEVRAELVLHGARPPAAGPELGDRGGALGGWHRGPQFVAETLVESTVVAR